MAGLFQRLKHLKPLRSLVYAIVGAFSYPGLTIVNKLKITGTEHISELPKRNVLFVSNHQTYFADVITFLVGQRFSEDQKMIPQMVFSNIYFQSQVSHDTCT